MGSHLWVEGTNDAHVLKHILEASGYAIHLDLGGVGRCDPWLCRAPVLHLRCPRTPGWQGLCDTILALPLNAGDVLGFVFDMDSPQHEQRPWPEIRLALASTFPALQLPATPWEDGWVGGAGHPQRVGFWAMPRGEREGTIEDLLWDGVPREDRLSDVVLGAVADAEALLVARGALRVGPGQGALAAAWRPKARVRTWLSLQPEFEGLLGRAWNQEKFLHGTPTERALVEWAGRLLRQGSALTAPANPGS